MAHSSNLIKKVKLGGVVYEIHDSEAIHSIADLENLGLNGVFQYKGTVAAVSNLPLTAVSGSVYHVIETDSEYVWVNATDSEAAHWEEFGTHIVVDHTHSYSSNVSIAGSNKSSTVSGSASVTGTNAASAVSGSGSVSVPKVTKETNYAKVSTNDASFVKSYPGATSKMVTTSVTPAGAATSVISSVTPTTASITGVSGSTTASKATAGTAVAIAKAGTAVSVPNVTKVGSASTWSFEVENGILTISGANGSAPTLGTAISITPAVSNGSITPYTFADVTVPKAASEKTVVTGVSTEDTDVATVGTAVTVATGSLSANGAGSSVMTGLGTASTGKALTSASLAEGTATDGVAVGDTVSISSESKTVNISGTAEGQKWSQASGTISGTAAAQVWTQTSGTTSGTTGKPN